LDDRPETAFYTLSGLEQVCFKCTLQPSPKHCLGFVGWIICPFGAVQPSSAWHFLFWWCIDALSFYVPTENARLTQFSWLSTRTQLTRPFDRQDMLGGLVMLASLTPLAHSLVLMSFMLD